ncbi:MAG: tRNA (N6-isopentenyl adenosine(37)-C2)-methylthiotransferase MiaB [Planctomycetaceae bacterium]|nr:tRNA (N6-isopentenyl adenosine(37)-C2)-methylthiotransferase MiaB [Planctomycetaceae bacterium]
MNMLDSELVVAALRKDGYELVATPKEADTILFNTCSVREHAEHKIYSALGRLKYSKRERPQRVIGVLGCMAQKDQDLIFRKAPHVDIVVGTGQLSEVPRLIRETRESTERIQQKAVSLGRRDGTRDEVSDSFQSYDPLRDPEMRPTPFQAFVRIMIGCDKFCTYCVVPATRGPEQSRPPSQILTEVHVLARQGVREVTLLGQTVNSYRFTENGRLWRLSDLLYAIHDVDGIERIRFVTSFPRDMTDDLLEAVRDLPKCVKYLHVPAQSGCNEMLKKMKRGYTVEEYREMMGRISRIMPECSVSSDFIVGFCGESEDSFQASMELIRECRFKNSFIFKYSKREGTKAFELFEDDIPEDVKRRRNNEMLELQNRISEEDNAEFIGRSVRVLVEGPSKAAAKKKDAEPADLDEGGAPIAVQLMGRSECDRIVVFDGNPRLIGTTVRVDVDDCTSTTLIGRIVTHEIQHGCSPLLPSLCCRFCPDEVAPEHRSRTDLYGIGWPASHKRHNVGDLV